MGPKKLQFCLICCALTVVALPSSAQTLPTPSHILAVIEENHAYSQIIGSSQAPYINTLASEGALFTQSYAVAHPSEPNYLALFSGSTQGLTSDTCPLTFHSRSLETELRAAGRTFAGYSEELQAIGSMVCASEEYARKHVPWTDFSGGKPADNLPFNQFPVSDFAKLPAVSVVIPDLMDDMHNGTVQQGDSWLQTHLLPYITWARENNSLFILTFDEDNDASNNHITTIFVGPMVKPGKYSEAINHYSVLRTIEQMYKLPYLGKSSTAAAITNVWK